MIILGVRVESEMSKGLARWMFVRSIGDVGLRPQVLWPVGVRCSLRRTLTLLCSNQDTNDVSFTSSPFLASSPSVKLNRFLSCFQASLIIFKLEAEVTK